MTLRLFQKPTLIASALLILFLSSCATPEKQAVPLPEPETQTVPLPEQPVLTAYQKPANAQLEKSATKEKPVPTVVTELIVIGEVEPVTIVAAGTTFPARIDTGATTSSLDAFDIQKFERDGKSWVKFKVKDRQTGKISQIESKITRIAEIKRHGAEPQERMVVKLKAKLGPKTMNTEFSLANRSSFEYPVLVGRNILDGNYAVDVSQKNSTSLMKEE